MTVYGYDPTLVSQTFHTVSAVMAYMYIMTGSTYHLVIHQAIQIPQFYHHLLCLIQCLVNGVTINDTPTFLTNEPTPQAHYIVINIKDPDAENYNLILPLGLKGVTSYLLIHTPNK